MLKQLYPAFAITVILTLITGIIYPLAVTAIANLIFKDQAQGSLIVKDGKVVGSRLIGQKFQGAGYFHSRPSAAGNGYDATSSSGTNLGPTSKKLIDSVKSNAETKKTENANVQVPVDLVTSSSSGLDPHISPASAEFQLPRVARERGISQEVVKNLIKQHTENRTFGVLGEPRVKVLELNLALNATHPMANSK
ncbi:MAG: potassium-transporting ATPase subunit KdpC [Acidobacteria bacterium]|nr:potassium-transporting ATPase subunit KdpC [Acidobacteriota bacterium]